MRKTIYTGKLTTSKTKTRNLLGFILILLLNKLERKTKKKREMFLDFIKAFQTHKKKARKRNKLAWIIQ